MTSGPDFTSVTPEAIEAYERDGAICLRGLLSPELIELSSRGIERSIASPGRFFRNQTPEGSAGRYLFEYWAWPHIPESGVRPEDRARLRIEARASRENDPSDVAPVCS